MTKTKTMWEGLEEIFDAAQMRRLEMMHRVNAICADLDWDGLRELCNEIEQEEKDEKAKLN